MLAALHREVSVQGQLWNSASGKRSVFHRFIQGHFIWFQEKETNLCPLKPSFFVLKMKAVVVPIPQ